MNKSAIEIFKIKRNIKDSEIVLDEVNKMVYVLKGYSTKKNERVIDTELKKFLASEIDIFKKSKSLNVTIFLEEDSLYLEMFDNDNINNTFGFTILEYTNIEDEVINVSNVLYSLIPSLELVRFWDAYCESEIIEIVEKYVPDIEQVNNQVESKIKNLKG